MKKKFGWGVLMVFIVLLTAYSLNINILTDDKEPTSTENDHDPDNKKYENNAFKEVTVSKSTESIKVKGKARVFEGVFQYAVVAGTEILLENHYQTDGAPA